MNNIYHTITAALPYANGLIHIGHLAGVYIPSDIYSRYLRSKKKKIIFISGSDEHGAPITIKAKKENILPTKIIDKYYHINNKSLRKFGVNFDFFSRTSSQIHKKIVQNFFMKLYNKNIFEVHENKQFYDTIYKQFLPDRYLIGTCSKCNHKKAYGDQCESCLANLNGSDLINPVSILSNKKPILKKTKHWYLPLYKYEKWLQNWLFNTKKKWKLNVYGQCRSWINQGLKSRSITRDLNWGIKLPLKKEEKKVLYVWFDAPIGYISGSQEWAKKYNTNWKFFWKKKNTKLINFIGKDNIVFHCIIFPIMLKEYGDFILPENVPANEFLNLESKKISTSENWAIWLDDYLIDFPNQQDSLRYILCSNSPETKDNNFQWKDFQSKNNNELVNILGNFVNRTFFLINKYFNGIIPKKKTIKKIDNRILKNIKSIIIEIEKNLELFKFKESISLFMNIAREGNAYLTKTEPWILIKKNKNRVKTILHICLQVIIKITFLSEIFLPNTSIKLYKIIKLKKLYWNNLNNDIILKNKTKIENFFLLFSKIENQDIKKQILKLKNKKNNLFPLN